MKIRFTHIFALIFCGLFLLTVYSVTHQFPTKRGGLYLIWAEQLANSSFLYPKSTLGYTHKAIPFAYPPIGIYAMAVPIALGTPGLLVMKIMPGITYILSIIVLYIFVTEYCDSSVYGLCAGVFALACPQILSQTIVGAGVTRSLGVLFMTAGLTFVYKSFKSSDIERRYLIFSGILFGLTILTHLIFALLFVYATVIMFVVLKPSISGIFRGIIIAVLGFTLAIPWVFVVTLQNDISVLFSPGGRFGTLYIIDMASILAVLLASSVVCKKQLYKRLEATKVLIGALIFILAFIVIFYNNTATFNIIIDTPYRLIERAYAAIPTLFSIDRSYLGYIYTAGGLLGSYYLIKDKKVFIPTLTAVWLLGYGHYPSVFLLLSILTGIATMRLLEYMSKMEYGNMSVNSEKFMSVCMICIMVPVLLFSGLYVADYNSLGTGSPPNALNSDSVEMMEWSAANTPSDSVFLVGGYNNGEIVDWFPAISNRTVSVSPWGTEWVVDEGYQRGYHLSISIRASNCGVPDCYNSIIEDMHSPPDFVVMPKRDANVSLFRDSSDYAIIYQRNNYVIVRVI